MTLKQCSEFSVFVLRKLCSPSKVFINQQIIINALNASRSLSQFRWQPRLPHFLSTPPWLRRSSRSTLMGQAAFGRIGRMSVRCLLSTQSSTAIFASFGFTKSHLRMDGRLPSGACLTCEPALVNPQEDHPAQDQQAANNLNPGQAFAQ